MKDFVGEKYSIPLIMMFSHPVKGILLLHQGANSQYQRKEKSAGTEMSAPAVFPASGTNFYKS